MKDILVFQMTSPIQYTTEVKCMTPLGIPPLRLSHLVCVSEWRSLNSGRNCLQKERTEEGQKKVSGHSDKEISKGAPWVQRPSSIFFKDKSKTLFVQVDTLSSLERFVCNGFFCCLLAKGLQTRCNNVRDSR